MNDIFNRDGGLHKFSTIADREDVQNSCNMNSHLAAVWASTSVTLVYKSKREERTEGRR